MATGINTALAPLLKGESSSAQAELDSALSRIHDAFTRLAASFQRLRHPLRDSDDDWGSVMATLAEISAISDADLHVLSPRLFRGQLRLRLKWIAARATKVIPLLQAHRDDADVDPSLLRQMEQLLHSGRRLRPVHNRLISYRNWWSVKTLSAVFALLAVAATLYLNSLSGMTPVSRAVVFPPGPHAASNTKQVLSSEPLNSSDYFAEFSRYYFDFHRFGTSTPEEYEFVRNFFRAGAERGDHPNPTVATEPLPHTPTRSANRKFLQIWKTELRNASYWQSEFLSTVTLQCELVRATEFPWNRLHTIPDVRRSFGVAESKTPGWARVIAGQTRLPASEELPVVRLANFGLGPAVHVQSKITANSGLVIMERNYPVLHGKAERLDYSSYSIGGAFEAANRRVPLVTEQRREQVDVIRDDGLPQREEHVFAVQLPARKDASPRIWPPLYYRLDTSPAASAASVAHEGVNYEVVETLSRLRELTTVAWRENADLEVTYESLTGQRHRMSFSFDLPQWLVYYRPADRILWYDPRQGKPNIHEVEEVLPIAEQVAMVLAPPQIEAVGEQRIRVGFTMGMWKSPAGDRQQQVAVVDRFLKPQGRLVIDINLVHPRNGRYSVTVLVNGDVRDRFYVDVLSPERFRFTEDAKEISRLQAVLFREPPQPRKVE